MHKEEAWKILNTIDHWRYNNGMRLHRPLEALLIYKERLLDIQNDLSLPECYRWKAANLNGYLANFTRRPPI